MKVARLASGVGVWACFTGCAAQPAPAPTAPAETRATATTAVAEERAAAPEESPGAVPAPAPPAPRDGLDAAKSKTARDGAEFGTLEAAERALNQAKADLDRLALAGPSPVVGQSAADDRAADKKESKASRPSAAGAAAPTKSRPWCEEACRALSSLSRAANAVCRLDGSSGAHCSHAKHVLAEAEQRVAGCSCRAAND